MSDARPPVVVLSGVRWGFLWQRHQTLATLFARAGYPTVFVETTGLANPGPSALRKAWVRVRKTGAGPAGDGGPTVYPPFCRRPWEPSGRRTGGFCCPGWRGTSRGSWAEIPSS